MTPDFHCVEPLCTDRHIVLLDKGLRIIISTKCALELEFQNIRVGCFPGLASSSIPKLPTGFLGLGGYCSFVSS